MRGTPPASRPTDPTEVLAEGRLFEWLRGQPKVVHIQVIILRNNHSTWNEVAILMMGKQ